MLIEELVPLMPEIVRRQTAIPHELQVQYILNFPFMQHHEILDDFLNLDSISYFIYILASLNFLATGSYQRRVGQDFLTCMSQTSLSRSLHATVNALVNVMDNWICFPVTADRIHRIKQG